jgi:subtilase family serine protease
LNNAFSQPLVTEYQQQQVGAGSQYWRSQWVRVPVIADGTYYLIFQTDADNALYESDEKNNSIAVPVTFKVQSPDLVPIAMQAPASVSSSPYPMLRLTWGVTNQGGGPADASWLDPVFDVNDTLIAYHSEPGPVPAGSSYWRADTIQAPVTTSGNYYLLFRANMDKGLQESDTDNNTLAVPITFNIQAPDLAPIIFQAPAQIDGPSNPNLYLVWGITNQGPGDIPANTFWMDELFLSTNSTLDTSTAFPLTSSYESGPIPSGGTYWRTNLVQIPATHDGTYYLFLDVNSSPYQKAVESDYSNNVASAQVAFHSSPPDLSPIFLQSSVTNPAAIYPLVTIAWAITNLGIGPAKGSPPFPWTVTFSVVQTNPANGSSTLVGSSGLTLTNLVAAGESYWSTNLLRFPIFESGTYFLTFTVNENGSLDESNTNNNSATNLLSVTIEPSDISPIYFSAPSAVTDLAYPSVALIWGATNTGLSALLPLFFFWDDGVYISTNAFVDSSAVLVVDWPQYNEIPQGGSYWRTNTVQLPVQESGNYYLILQLDIFNVLGETDRSNNVAVIPIQVNILPPTDLAPLGFAVPTNTMTSANPTLTVVWGVTNQGTTIAQSRQGWSDAVYLSTSPTLDGTETYIGGGYETNDLAPGGFYWRTNSVFVPVSENGRYYLVFKTDAYSSVLETDYGNNTLAVPVTFTIAPPDLAPIEFSGPTAITGAPNPSVTLVVGVTNQGVGGAIGAYDALYISGTPTRDSSARIVATWARTNEIAPGGSYWLTNTVRLPVGDGGNYYLLFEADTDNALDESDPLNNVATVPIHLEFSLQPDLVVSNFLAPNFVNGAANPTVQFSWYVVNQGLGPAIGPWSDTIILYTNNGFYPVMVVGTLLEDISLPVGGGYWRTNSFTMPLSQSGYFYLSFQTDFANDLSELDENNNYRSIPFSFNLTIPSTKVGLTAGQLQSDGSFILWVFGLKNNTYTLQTSSNLIDWTRSMDFVCTNVPTLVTDNQAGQFARRFYRVGPDAGGSATSLRLDLGSSQPWSASGLELALDGPLLATYRIESSTNLVDWVSVTNFSSIFVSPVHFLDTSATRESRRFYRATTP